MTDNLNETNISDRSELINLIEFLWVNKIKIILFNGIIGVIALIYLIFLPNWYKSTVTIMVQEDSNSLNVSAIFSQMMPFGFGSGLLGQNSVNTYLRILGSHTMSEKVIKKFNLKKVYDLDKNANVFKELAENTAFIDNEDGSFSIHCEYEESPEIAADMANYYYDELVEVVRRINKESSGSFREFVEENYQLREKKLIDIEESFKNFQIESKLINLEEQTKVAINILAELEMAKLKLELQRDYLRLNRSSEDKELGKYESFVLIQQKKIDTYKTQTLYSNLPVENIADMGLEYHRHYRDVSINGKLTEFLALQLEQARIDEKKLSSDLYLLDPGNVSDKKSKPKRMSTLFVIMILSFSFNVIYLKLKQLIISQW